MIRLSYITHSDLQEIGILFWDRQNHGLLSWAFSRAIFRKEISNGDFMNNMWVTGQLFSFLEWKMIPIFVYGPKNSIRSFSDIVVL